MGKSDASKTERWDAIVIGSGLGGLSTAAYLCAAGKRTLVLESHYVAGGNSQVFRRKRGDLDYEFDVGIHAPEGHTNLQIMTLAPREYGIWNVDKGPAEGGSYHRDPDYRSAKDELADYLIGQAEQIVPGLSDHIVWKEAATPVTQERFTRSTSGTSTASRRASTRWGRCAPYDDA